MENRFPHLFSPIRIGSITLKNRIMGSPISLFDLAAAPEHGSSPEDVLFYRLRAAGGAAVVTVGDSIVHPSGNAEGLNDDKISIYMPSSVPFLRKVTDAIHSGGALANIELNHDGVRAAFPGRDGWGASACTRENGGRVLGMTEEMIAEVAEGFGVSALNAKRAGFDMVMVHAGHGWLLGQFLSPFWNHRTDRFGGSLVNRARFTLMVIDSIRRHCGGDFPVEVRLSGDEAMPGELPGFGTGDAVAFAQLLDGRADLIHVSAGNNNFPASEIVSHPPMFFEHGVNVKYAAQIRSHVRTLVAAVGAISDPEMMEEILASGKADLIAVGRALIADPELPARAAAGRTEDIRPCLRCWRCLGDAVAQGGPLHCSVDPEIGREALHFHPLPLTPPKKVLVAGGGPGGMQAALTAASREHRVILCEKEGELGGTLRYCRDIPFKSDMRAYMDYLIRQVGKDPRIEVRLHTAVTPALIADVSPDHMIAAIGAVPAVPPIPGIEHAQGLLDTYLQRLPVGERVVIVGGGLAGVEAAIEFAREGRKPVVIEMGSRFAAGANLLHGFALQVEVEKLAIDIRLDTRCVRIAPGLVTCESRGSARDIESGTGRDGGARFDLAADTVIIAAGMRPRSGETEALRACFSGRPDSFESIGDCRQAAQIREAVTGGYLAALKI